MGGGAGCSYIRHSIETRFQTHPKIGKVKFLYPPKPLIAIAKGAALSADSRHIVMERVCARSYGTTSRQRFDAALDDEEDAVNNATGEKMVDNGCDWLITKVSVLHRLTKHGADVIAREQLIPLKPLAKSHASSQFGCLRTRM